ncbi:MAG: ABC transporter substrate-binding protein [Balneolaceae bacterium]|nr:ABC transporter substrate-binding protein [Balneolaceae bacterium]
MKQNSLRNFALFILLLTVAYACSSSESTVVVVEDEPATKEAARQDTVAEEFTQLNIGLIDSVTNFDPLFAENLSTQRTLNLIYDGLFTLDRQGNPIPDIVSSVEISEDSLEYVFTLKQNKYFHNSSIFNSGIGRRVNASDIKNAFERTARLTVPDHAAQLLMGIRGFRNYYLEQRAVYDPNQRVLQEVAGIQVIDSQTLGIVLEEKDPQFLTKLASPYLLIYPQEAIRGNSSILADRPIGTGSYQFNRVDNNGQIVLMRRDNGNDQQNPLINRINLQSFSDEVELFQEFTTNETDWIPEIGPEISTQILTENGDLQSSYESDFKLVQHNASRIAAFYLNEEAGVNHDWLINRLAYLTEEDISTRGELVLNVDEFEITEEAEPLERYFVSYTEDALTRRILTELHNTIFMPNSSLVLFDIRVPTEQTSIYTHNSSSLHHNIKPIDTDYWMQMETDILGVYKDRVSGIEPTTIPWLLHIDQVRVQNTETSTE